MKEANVLSAQDRENLLTFMESCFNLTIPRNKERFGLLSFHLYQYDKKKDGNAEFIFQIRWGTHQLFSKKHLVIDLTKEYIPSLYTIIEQNKTIILQNAIAFCENQLNTIAMLEIEPELNRKMPLLGNYQILVRKIRQLKNNAALDCLTHFGLCILWQDETGDFQEFVYPIPYDTLTGRFQLSAAEIVSKFQVYRDVQGM